VGKPSLVDLFKDHPARDGPMLGFTIHF
jgi:hypothetical protein